MVGLTLILDPRSRAVCFLLLAAFFIQLFRMNIGHLSSDWKPHVLVSCLYGTLVWVHYMNLNSYITFVITFNVLTLLEGIWPCRN